MNRKKILSAFLVAAMLTGTVAVASGCAASVNPADPNQNIQTSIPGSSSGNETSTPNAEKVDINYGLTDNIADGVILHAWTWSFNTIKESMADIAAAGYSTIQTSPINACVVGGNGGMQLMGQGKWYYHYQPTDWTIGNYQLGTEEEFKAMCDEADRYGIKIIVDVVPNHTTSTISEVSQNLIDAVGGQDKLYHSNGTVDVSNYGDRKECTTQAVGGVPDVDTENPAFQDYFIKFLNQCIADGADGFRYDTAKHIGLPDDPKDNDSQENNFWQRVTTEITNASSIFNYGEVLQGDNERIQDYIKAIGHTTASSYGSLLRSQISSGILKADNLSDLMVGDSTDVVTWVESHDTYTDGSSLSLTDEQIVKAWAIIAASGNGTPLFYDRPFEANSDNQWGSMNRIGAVGSSLYKDSSVAAVNRFRNAMVGESTKISNLPENKNSVIIERGSKGAVLVNARGNEIDVDMSTSLADGTYINRVDGTGEFTVSGGKLTGKLSGNSVVVLYNDGYIEPVSMPSVSADVSSFTTTGDSIDITLHVQNSSKNTYTINGTSAEFNDGDKVTVNLADTDNITVSATNEQGLTSNMTYYFTKLSIVSSGSEIYFEKPSSWSDKVYVYIYDETVKPTQTNAQWPGVLMTKNDDKYSYTTDKDWTSGLVIFSDDSGNQYPATMEPGDALVAGQTYKSNTSGNEKPNSGISDKPNNPEAVTINFKGPSTWGDVYAYVYENGGGGKNAEWPGEKMTNNGDGTYSYTVPSNIPKPVVIFTDGFNQYPVANEAGLEIENGKTYETNESFYDSSTPSNSDGATVKFTKPDEWNNDVYAYVYESGGSNKNAEWPGEKMTNNGDGTYSYTVSSDISNPLIIFNDGKKQYPRSNGLKIEDGKSYNINS